TLKLRLDEECYVKIFHVDAGGKINRVFPSSFSPSLLQKGVYEFPGIVEGTHDEIQKFITLATKAELTENDLFVERLGLSWLAAFNQYVQTLPAEQWSWSEYSYRVVDTNSVSLEDLEESCTREVRDRSDKEKPACGEVCRR